MDEAAIRQRVAGARVGRLCTLDADGRIHPIPFCYALHGDTLYSAVDHKPKRSARLRRLDNIRAHPEVVVLVDHYEDDWSRLWWVRVRGRARILDHGSERETALRRLAAKYPQYRADPPTGPVLAISVEEWAGWSA